MDIYFASSSMNMIIVAIASSSLNFAITPILIKHYKKRQYKSLVELATSFFNLLFLTFVILALVQFIFARPILQVLLPGFAGEKLQMTIDFFRIQAIASAFTISTSLFVSLQYMLKKFYRTITYPAISKILQVAFVLLSYRRLGIYSLIWGLLLERIASFVLLGAPFIRYYRFRVVLSDQLRGSVKTIYPLIFSSSFSKSNVVVDRFFASMLSPGSITVLDYGQKIVKMISSFVNKGVSIVSLRRFSTIENDDEAFNKLFTDVYSVMIFVVVPVALSMILFLEQALQIIVVSDRITPGDVRNIYLMTVAFLGIFLGGSLTSVVTNAFYAKGLTMIISKVNVVIQIVGIALKIGAFFLIGIWALPIGLSVVSVATTVVLLVLYDRKIHKLDFRGLILYLVKVSSICTVAAAIPYGLNRAFGGTVLISVASGVLFLVIYFLASLIFERGVSRMILARLSGMSKT